MFSSTLVLTSALDGDGWSTPHFGRFTLARDPVPLVEEAGWAPGPVWRCAENLATLGFDPRVALIQFRKGRISEVRSSVCLLWNFVSVKADILPRVLISQNDSLRTETNYRMKTEGMKIKNKSPDVDLWCTFSLTCFNLVVFVRHIRTWK